MCKVIFDISSYSVTYLHKCINNAMSRNIYLSKVSDFIDLRLGQKVDFDEILMKYR